MAKTSKTIAICGSTGFIGRNLIHYLQTSGYIVKPITREHLQLPPHRLGKYLKNVDALINLAGSPVTSRWTEKNRNEILHSRINPVLTIKNALVALDIRLPKIINA